jgi:hypothetical protein
VFQLFQFFQILKTPNQKDMAFVGTARFVSQVGVVCVDHHEFRQNCGMIIVLGMI